MIYYHGTTDKFDIKDNILKPSIETGILRENWRKKNLNKVYLTTSLLSAEKFAYKACQKYGGCGVIYEVEPLGDFYNPNTNEYVTDNAKILKIVSRYDKERKSWISR